jgi:hypothetical protein
VSYPDNTPQHILDQAICAVKEAGGTILHEYTLIKGFAVSSALSVSNPSREHRVDEPAIGQGNFRSTRKRANSGLQSDN